MHESLVYLVVFVVLVVTTESGYRLGRCIQHRMTDEQKSHLDAVMARVWTFRDRVPEGILFALAFVAVLGMGLMGVSSGLKNARNLVPTTAMAFAVATALVLIVDLDRPERGVITVSQQALVDLSESMTDSVRPSAPQHCSTDE